MTLTLLAPSACQHGPDDIGATAAEKTNADRSFIRCVREASPAMDDKVSAPSVVANAIVNGPCRRSAESVAEVYTRGSDPKATAIFRANYFNGIAQQIATEVVFLARHVNATTN